MEKLKIVIPKGRIYTSIIKLLIEAGYGLEVAERAYTPIVEDDEIEAKIMKPQNIPQLVELGAHDVGFTGYDWIVETQSKVIEIMDLGFNPVKIVAAVPMEYNEADLKSRQIVVATEYENITRQYLEKMNYNYVLLRTFGATEVFPPEDADMIVDNTSTGRTLKEHNLKIIDTVMVSSTRFIANRKALDCPWKRKKISEIEVLFNGVLNARSRVMLEMNIPKDKFDNIIKNLPCMKSPTVSPLFGGEGYAVKIAVKKNTVIKLIPELKRLGASDILEYELRKVLL